MTQVKLTREPYCRQAFYKGTYTHKNQKYDFILSRKITKDRTEINIEFIVDVIPFDKYKARKQILEIFITDEHENKN